jgi:hypothetical protein
MQLVNTTPTALVIKADCTRYFGANTAVKSKKGARSQKLHAPKGEKVRFSDSAPDGTSCAITQAKRRGIGSFLHNLALHNLIFGGEVMP